MQNRINRVVELFDVRVGGRRDFGFDFLVDQLDRAELVGDVFAELIVGHAFFLPSSSLNVIFRLVKRVRTFFTPPSIARAG